MKTVARWKKYGLGLLVMALLAGALAGCSSEQVIEYRITGTTSAQTEPATVPAVPGYAIPLSAEKRQEIEEHIGHPLNLDSDYSEYRYYGTYGDGVVLFSVPVHLDGFYDMEVAGELFQHWNYFSINVYQDGKFYELEYAYENGLLTEAQIAEIAEYHRVCEENRKAK